jgi:hypothetical protein
MSIKPAPKPKKPAPDFSNAVLLALTLFALALIGGLVALALPAVGPFAIVLGLTGTGVSVLSLREDR